jgi:hypothetical protein
MTDLEAEIERLKARLRWVRDVTCDDPRPWTALVRIWEGVCEELGEGR